MEYNTDAYTPPSDFFSRDETLMQIEGDSDVFTLRCEDERYPEAEIYICCSSSNPEKVFAIISFENWNRVEDYRVCLTMGEKMQLAALIRRLSTRLTGSGEADEEFVIQSKKNIGEITKTT